MADSWPSNPSNGQTFEAGNGTTYTYNSSTKSWKATGSGSDALTAGYGLIDDNNTWSVDTEVIADTEWVKTQLLSDVGDGQLQPGVGLVYTAGLFNANASVNSELNVDTDVIADTEWVRDLVTEETLTWSNIILGGEIGASGTNSSSQSYLSYTYLGTTYYRVFVSGGESIRTDQNDAATEVVSKTY